MIELFKALSGFSRVEQFLPKLFEYFEGDLCFAEIVDSDLYLSHGDDAKKGLNKYLIQEKLSLSFSRKLNEKEISSLDLLFTFVLNNLLVIAKLRKVSYKGWQRSQSDKRIIVKSEAMSSCMEKVKLVAPHGITVLLQGESGTGKEVIAKYIYAHSGRNKKCFVTVNCAALPKSLIDSTLFGHVKGAFTGADKERKGFFEKARGGTLFLDEIGDLPLETQSRLLRVIEYGDFSPLGSDEVIKSDVRIIAASHLSLKDAVMQGIFRKDLYFRLAAFPVYIPALRERKEDIPDLIKEIIIDLSSTLKLSVNTIDSSTYKKALEYSWPGNIRELKNVLEKSIIMSKGTRLKLIIDDSEIFQKMSMKSFDEEVKGIIEAALIKCGGRVDGEGGAAELLSLKAQTLYSKIRKYKVKR